MSIKFCPECKCFFLDGRDFTYALNVNEDGFLNHVYYGKKISHADLSYYKPTFVTSFAGAIPGSKKKFTEFMWDYATDYLGDFREPAMVHVDKLGSSVCVLKYMSHEILEKKPPIASGIPTAKGGATLVITVGDDDAGIYVKLYYTVYENENIITRRAEITNGMKDAVHLSRALSLTLDFYDSNFEMLTLHGHHNTERMPQRNKLTVGRTSIGNVRGETSAQHSPFVALVRPGTDEEMGEVFASSLMYSGSHYESVEVDDNSRTRLSVGINPDSFCWQLNPGEAFETPEAVLNYSDEGLGKMSRQYHDFFRNYVINPRWVREQRPVVLNSWEGMHFSFDRDRLFGTIDRLKGTGIDLFVLDDGWFGARNNDKAGLGDWFVNETKLPGGLKVIADRCHQNGLNFGLWIEPEMVNPDSDLYRAHPDWAIASPYHPAIPSRNQYILDFSRADVVDYIKKLMYDVIANSGADYIKWDMNRSMTENWSHTLPAGRQGELQHRYVLGVYELARYLIGSFPDIMFEGCSGGGARFDGAMLQFFPQIWTSDNTDADDRTNIQYGTNLVFPLSVTSNHVSLSPNIRNGRIISISSRTNIAYNGAFGYEFDLDKVPAEELARIPDDIRKYREIDRLMLDGDLYRGANHTDSNFFLTVIVSKDKNEAYATFYQSKNTCDGSPKFKLPGLADDKLYHIDELDLTLPGSVLKNVGISIKRFTHDFASRHFTIHAV